MSKNTTTKRDDDRLAQLQRVVSGNKIYGNSWANPSVTWAGTGNAATYYAANTLALQ